MRNISFSLKVKSGPGVSNSCVLSHDKAISFGRHKENDCILANDSGISRKHFEIFFEDEKCWIKDLNSRNGTYLNDHSILSSELKEGDEIRVGNTRLVVSVSNGNSNGITPTASRLGPKMNLMIRDSDSTTVIAARHLHAARFGSKFVLEKTFIESFHDLPGRVILINGNFAATTKDVGPEFVRISNRACLMFASSLKSLEQTIGSIFGTNSIILMNHSCARSQFIIQISETISKFESPQTFLDEYQELPQELSNALLHGIDLVVCETSDPEATAAIFEKKHATWLSAVIKRSDNNAANQSFFR